MAYDTGYAVAQGLLGAVMGGAQAAQKTALDEMKEEMERRREERLSQLRREEYKAKSQMDIENIAPKSAAETKAMGEREEALRPTKLETRRQEGIIDTELKVTQARAGKELEAEFLDFDIEKNTRKAVAEAEAKQPFELQRISATAAASGANQLRALAATEEARKQVEERAAQHKWTPGADGNYYDGNGALVTTAIRIEGRTERVPIKVPDSKLTKGKAEVYSNEDQIKALDKEILAVMRDGDKSAEKRLRAERQRLLGGVAPPKVKDPQAYIDSILRAE